MKKLLSILIAVLSIATSTAQFQVAQKVKAIEVIWQDTYGWNTLCRQEQNDGVYYYMLILKSSNQFDNKIVINLGGLEKTKNTLSQLINDLFVKGEVYNLVDDKGEAFVAKCGFGKTYSIYKDGYAGYGGLYIGRVEAMLSALLQIQ